PHLARVRPEAHEFLLRQSRSHLAVEDADGRRDRARCSHLALGLQPDRDALAWREAVRDERRLERDDRASGAQGLAHLVGEAYHTVSSISTKRLSSPRRTSWKPARRYARRARSFQLATQSRNVRGRHSRCAYSRPAAMNGCASPRPVRSGRIPSPSRTSCPSGTKLKKPTSSPPSSTTARRCVRRAGFANSSTRRGSAEVSYHSYGNPYRQSAI